MNDQDAEKPSELQRILTKGKVPIFAFRHETMDGTYAAWSPDGTRIVSFGGGMQLWDFVSRRHIMTHDYEVWAAHWNRAGDKILSVESHEVTIWNGLTGQKIYRLPHPYDPLVSEAFWSQDDRRVLTRFKDEVNVWDAENGMKLCAIRSPANSINNAAWCFGESHVVAADKDNVIRFWRIVDGALVSTIPIPKSSHFGVEAWLSPDESRGLAHNFYTSAVFVFDTQAAQISYEITPQPDMDMRRPGWSPDGAMILTNSVMRHRKGQHQHHTLLEIWNAADGSKKQEFYCADCIWDAIWSHDSQRLLAYGQEGVVRLWDVSSGALIREYMHESSVESVSSWLQDEALLITDTENCYVRIWDEHSAEVLFEVQYDGLMRSAMLHPSQKYLLISSMLDFVDVWEVNLSR